jgi:Uma2 family endonuclease
MTLIDPIVHSPRMPQYLRELEQILACEKERRRRFFAEVREGEKAEFINGEVIVHSPVNSEHEETSTNIFQLMRACVQLHSLGRVAHEKLLISLTRNDYEPDICFFASEKADRFKPDQMKFPAPDLAVEVLSRSTEKTDRTIKFEDYALHGVDEYWIVDPRKKSIEQYLLTGEKYALSRKGAGGMLKCRAIKGFEFPIRAAFDREVNLKALRAILAGSR